MGRNFDLGTRAPGGPRGALHLCVYFLVETLEGPDARACRGEAPVYRLSVDLRRLLCRSNRVQRYRRSSPFSRRGGGREWMVPRTTRLSSRATPSEKGDGV